MFYFLIWVEVHRCVHFVKMYRVEDLELCAFFLCATLQLKSLFFKKEGTASKVKAEGYKIIIIIIII